MAQRLDETAKGVFIISATPFDERGSIDHESAERLVDFYLESEVAGITILGMMGEAQKLDSDETRAFAETVLRRVAGRVPVVAGVSASGLDNMKRLSSDLMAAGAAGVMVAPMSSLRTEEAVFGYFQQVADYLGDTPIVLQDFPQATNVHLSSRLIDRMAQNLPSMVMLKHEDCPGLDKISQVREFGRTAGRRISILVGNGGLYYPQELKRGADGAMTGFAYPEMLVRVHQLFSSDPESAEDLYDAYLPLVRYEQQPGFGLAVRKYVLRRRGLIDCEITRAPGPHLKPRDIEEIEGLIARLEKRLL